MVHQHPWGHGLAHARHCVTSCARARGSSTWSMWTPTKLLPPRATPDRVSPRGAGPPSHEGLPVSQSCSLGIVPQPETAAELPPGCPCHLDRQCHPILLILSPEPCSWSNSLWSWRTAGEGASSLTRTTTPHPPAPCSSKKPQAKPFGPPSSGK